MAGQNMNRTTPGADQLLPQEISSEIWAETLNESLVMQVSTPMGTLPAGGVKIPVITGEPEADWVGETEEISVGEHSLDIREMASYKMGIIEPFSKEFRRDLPALYNELKTRLPKAIGRKFDSTVLHGTAPGEHFSTLTGAPTATLARETAAADYLNALLTVQLAGGDLSAWVISPQAEALTMSAVDAQGNYIFVPNARDTPEVGRIWGRNVLKSKAVYRPAVADDPATTGVDETAPAVLGLAGDFSSARYGFVEGITISVSDQSTINRNGTQLNLWQRDMFAIKVTVELGFMVRNADHFVRLVQG